MNSGDKSMFTPVQASLGKRFAAFLLDAILFVCLFTGALLVSSYAVGYQANYEQLEEKYIEHGVFIKDDNNEYVFCDTENKDCQDAWDAFNDDEEACAYYDKSIALSVAVITVASFTSLLVFEYIIPLIFKNGQTIGMKILKIGLIDKNGIKINHMQLFIRFLFGKFLISMILPIYGFIYMMFNFTGGLYGFILFAFINLMNILMFFTGKNHAAIPDAISNVYAVNIEETYIFDSIEEKNMKIAEVEKQKK